MSENDGPFYGLAQPENVRLVYAEWVEHMALRNHPLRYLVLPEYNLRERAGYTASEVLWLAAPLIGRALVAVERAANRCSTWGGE